MKGGKIKILNYDKTFRKSTVLLLNFYIWPILLDFFIWHILFLKTYLPIWIFFLSLSALFSSQPLYLPINPQHGSITSDRIFCRNGPIKLASEIGRWVLAEEYWFAAVDDVVIKSSGLFVLGCLCTEVGTLLLTSYLLHLQI